MGFAELTMSPKVFTGLIRSELTILLFALRFESMFAAFVAPRGIKHIRSNTVPKILLAFMQKSLEIVLFSKLQRIRLRPSVQLRDAKRIVNIKFSQVLKRERM